MAIKVNGTEVVSDAKKGSFNTVNPGAFSTANRPPSPTEGDVIYDTDEDSLMFWNGTEWKKVGSGGLQPAPNIVSAVLTQDQQNSNRFTGNSFTSTINNVGGAPDNLEMTAKVVGQLTVDASTATIASNNYPGTESSGVNLTLDSNYNLDNNVFEVDDVVQTNATYTPTTSAISTSSAFTFDTAGIDSGNYVGSNSWTNFWAANNVATASPVRPTGGTVTYTFDTFFTVYRELRINQWSAQGCTNSKMRIYYDNNKVAEVLSNSPNSGGNAGPFIFTGSFPNIYKIEAERKDSNDAANPDQIFIDGVGWPDVAGVEIELTDSTDIELFQVDDKVQGNPNWNQSQMWSANATYTNGLWKAEQSPDKAFNGTGEGNGFTWKTGSMSITFSNVNVQSQVKLTCYGRFNGDPFRVTIGGVTTAIGSPTSNRGTITFNGTGALTEISQSTTDDYSVLAAVEVDGVMLVDSNIVDPDGVKVTATNVSDKKIVVDGGTWNGPNQTVSTTPKRGEGTIKTISGTTVVIEPFVDNCFKESQYLTHKTPKSITSDLKTDPIESYNASTKTIKLDGLTNLTEYEPNMAVKMVNPDGTDVLPFVTSAITNVTGGTPSNYQAGSVLTNPANIYDGTAGNFATCSSGQGQGPICTSNGSTLRYLGIRLQSFGTTQINTFTVEGIDYTFSTDTTAPKTYTVDLGSNVTLTQPIQFQSTVSTGYILGIYFDGRQLVNYTPQILTLTDGTNLDKFAVDDSVQGEYKGVYFGTGGQASPGFAATSTINFLSTAKQPITGSPGSSHCVVDLIDATTDMLITSSVTGYTSAASIDGVNWTVLGNVNGGSAYSDYSIRNFLVEQLGEGTANGIRYFSWGGLTDWTACQIQLTESWITAATSSSLVPDPALDARIKVIDIQNPNGSGVYQMTVSGGSWTNLANNSLDDYLWDNYIEGDPEPNYPLSNLFGGTIGSGYANGTRAVFLGPNSTLTLNIESLNISATTVKLYIYSAAQPNIFTVNGVQQSINTATGDKEVEVTVNGQVKTIAWSYDSTSAPYCYMKGIEFDGKLLVNRGVLAENNVQIVKNGSGVVQFKDLTNRTIALSSSNNQWLEDFCVASTTDRPVVSTTGFVRFDGLGAVECVESYPLAPVNMLDKNTPKLQFPLEFECVSSAPDAELGAGTYLETSFTATNSLGTSSATSNILVPSTTTRVAPAAESYEVNVTEYAETAAKIKTASDRAAQQRVDSINETIEQAQQAAEDRANDYLN